MIFASNVSLALLSGKSRNAATSVPTEWFVAVLLDSLMSFEVIGRFQHQVYGQNTWYYTKNILKYLEYFDIISGILAK